MSNELYHHGILGMKWGVRRYQNKDGSLTYAGKKRALKMQDQYTEFSKNKKYRDKDGNLTYTGRKKDLKMKEQYSELTGGKRLKKYSSSSGKTAVKPKSISEMSNEEIQAKIDRIRLENTLKSLTPQQISRGERFANGLKDATISIAKDKGTKLVGDYVDKQLRSKLGLSNKDSKTAAQILQEEAQKYENRQKIDRGQQYFKEGKYAENKSTSKSSSKKSADDEPLRGTVEGEGTSKKTNDEQKARNHYYDDPIDVEWKEVNSNSTSRGESYVNQFLLEDKKKRR